LMKAVPSSYHQLLYYPTPTGIANIRGEQAMFWSIAQKKSEWIAKNTRVASSQDHPSEKKQKQVATQ